jgi:hypothetical protein
VGESAARLNHWHHESKVTTLGPGALTSAGSLQTLVGKKQEEYRVYTLCTTLGANMKPISILPLAIVLATTSAVAQDTVLLRSPQATPSVLMQPRTPSVDCPVGIKVSHGPSSLKRDTEFGPFASPSPKVQEQRIQFTMTNPSRKEIVSAQITVYGFSDKWRAIPLAGAKDAPDLRKRLDLVLNVKGNDHASSDLSLNRFTSVAYVNLDSLTYADGATWKASSPAACSVTPDPLMLVSAARQ